MSPDLLDQAGATFFLERIFQVGRRNQGGIFRQPHPPLRKSEHRRLLLWIGGLLGKSEAVLSFPLTDFRRQTRLIHGRLPDSGEVSHGPRSSSLKAKIIEAGSSNRGTVGFKFVRPFEYPGLRPRNMAAASIFSFHAGFRSQFGSHGRR
jgi:hypothetical protein